ncbi:MAG: hypothetical protein KAI71_01015 [Candidatus Pacebacteria bacterium]|nr:hypothetical protein [Candidatus Paceibacterota bacterium]
MIKELVKFFVAIIIGVLILILLQYKTGYFQTNQEVDQIQIQEKVSGTYFNERFGYEIACNDPWYIWPYYSREMAVVRQTKLWKLISFRQKWTVESSEIIFLNNSSQEELDQFFDEDGSIAAVDLPVGHWIQIFPIDIDPDLKKESLKEKGSSRIEVKPMILQSGLKAQQVDTRSLTGGTLSVLVPHNFDAKLDSGKQAMSLNFVTDAEVNSDSEKAFYEIINSLSFK